MNILDIDKLSHIEKFNELERLISEKKALLREDVYISHKMYLKNNDLISYIIEGYNQLEKSDVLFDFCKKNKISYSHLKKLINDNNDLEKLVLMHNKEFVERSLKSEKIYLDSILKEDDPNIVLDEEQRKVVLSDEDYTLVIAGAGSGKTTTIEAKVKYLVEKKNIDPNRILVVSFTNKATNELKARFKKIQIPIEVSTFHSIGYTLIRSNDAEKKTIAEKPFMYSVIEKLLKAKASDEYFIRRTLLFFASYLNMPIDEDNMSLLFKTLAANDLTSLKTDLANILDNYKKEQTKSKITLKEERVRSIDECRIANFLFINGIDYEYEPRYPYLFKNSLKPYCPDFLIKYKGREIYLEHFGISQSGENNRYSEEELRNYKQKINEKVKLHKEHKTNLIYTFSKYNDERDLIVHLQELLEENDISLDRKNDKYIYEKIAENIEGKYFNKLIQLLCNFISRIKVCNYNFEAKYAQWMTSVKSERTKLFLEIAIQCYHKYEEEKVSLKKIDFDDMINNAVNILDYKIKSGEKLPYDYIFVDEYQDISLQRFDLCEKLSKASDAKIVAVGDDWQSIFRFSGSQIDLFTNFKEKMGYAEELKITNTYRNSQELINIAGNFIMENDKQIKKTLKSNKSIKEPVVLMSYDDSLDKDTKQHGPFYRLGSAIERSLEIIVKNHGLESSVLLIGRYNFDGKNLSRLEDFFYWDNNRIKSKKYPKLNIDFLTAHASKGLGYDNVIIINGKDDVLGFPSKIEDDPVMKLVINDNDQIDFEEERRLFYVALTRTKNRVYIITPQYKPSKFILEIKNKFTNVVLNGDDLTPIESQSSRFYCPRCHYPLQKRTAKFNFLKGIQKLWICSNDPEVCGFLTNDLNGNAYNFSITKCPECADGYLIVKPIKNQIASSSAQYMMGCTNFKADKSGCLKTMNERNFTQDKNELLIDKNGKQKKSYIKKLVCTIIDTIASVYKKYPEFKFNLNSLKDFLLGENNKAIDSFKLYNDLSFGILDDNKLKYYIQIIELLVELDIIKYEKVNNFKYIILNSDRVSDKQVQIIEEQVLYS